MKNRAKSKRSFVAIDGRMAGYYPKIVGPFAWTIYTYLKRCHSRKTGLCVPSYQRIADNTGMCRMTVIRHMKRLKAENLVRIVPRFHKEQEKGRRSNQYDFTYPSDLDAEMGYESGDGGVAVASSPRATKPTTEILPPSRAEAERSHPEPTPAEEAVELTDIIDKDKFSMPWLSGAYGEDNGRHVADPVPIPQPEPIPPIMNESPKIEPPTETQRACPHYDRGRAGDMGHYCRDCYANLDEHGNLLEPNPPPEQRGD